MAQLAAGVPLLEQSCSAAVDCMPKRAAWSENSDGLQHAPVVILLCQTVLIDEHFYLTVDTDSTVRSKSFQEKCSYCPFANV